MNRLFTRSTIQSFKRLGSTQKRFINNGRPILKSGLLTNPFLFSGALIGAGLFTYYAFDAKSSVHEYIICPLIRNLTDAEDGHRLGVFLMSWGISPKLRGDNDDKLLEVNLFDKKLSNPVGIAAGLDKNGEIIDPLFDVGFGYVEIGSITPVPQPGNPKPRFFRLPKDDAVINRYGFNSNGHLDVVIRLKERLESFFRKNNVDSVQNNSLRDGKILAINLGKNKTGDEVQDYLTGVENFNQFADVLVINVSSPNTPGLRNLQGEAKLTNLLKEVVNKRDSLIDEHKKKTPILVKVAPDLDESEIKSIVYSAKESKINGIIVSNTTIQRPGDLKSRSDLTSQVGGLSGKPLKPLSLKALRTAAKYTKDSDLILVGCGGISSGKDVLEFGKAGAKYVELYTSFAYKGPGLVYKIKKELTEELQKEGKTWEQIVGSDLK
ncbi:Dihydroorotate dehydrogenase, mitochondrial [Wickerhamomyces ciferrii]|uniref:Dihydroorotate dehydrogenase (quinone), mitochondrial n=1 Tax=Wickerhamomyces ciferrii (strain ATCC 14091 / BCRC 22168 / CBS 111 / JCM 3599 / NBRC 0793 / NRRL Y-1031 F-60-10) TaxID=1206466 RepID=K0KQ66_WICCF|nr:Dihydroorotate dehydrogenase, mitochondrial [Wickerhamomyces ciferrii]CCH43353.1 Dihydroorotate dehydrogenase, mitochondrial [Wickerhamomyces ciferrii]